MTAEVSDEADAHAHLKGSIKPPHCVALNVSVVRLRVTRYDTHTHTHGRKHTNGQELLESTDSTKRTQHKAKEGQREGMELKGGVKGDDRKRRGV